MTKVSAKKVLVTSFLVDLLDVALNTAVAIVTGSMVILAETLQGATDLATDQIELLIDQIKKKIQEAIPNITHIQIELETPD
ncbi:hypothetical protein HYU92_02060 [Candidatus Curtissbacteria bacterium]|nr:hypothetical protein [Candidatus Curtissbacteria bacterium]